MSKLSEEEHHTRVEQLGLALIRQGVYAQVHYQEINRRWGVRVALSQNINSHPFLFVSSVDSPEGPAWEGYTDGMNWIHGGSVFIRDCSVVRVAASVEALQDYLLSTLHRKPADLPNREEKQPPSSSEAPRVEGAGGALAQLTMTERSGVEDLITYEIEFGIFNDWGYEDHDDGNVINRAELVWEAAVEALLKRVREERNTALSEYREGYKRSEDDDEEDEDDDGY